ncbi:MAG: D-tyrosyl-tRNA(Tyr) deacylase [Promethearchaeota archaeon]|nr:MAG: D-tyrosyl-tRNA(Tyr) deacylase [Candidatus Lokiarchaeota archaeon]
MPDIIFSKQDLASQTIFQQIMEHFDVAETDDKFEGNKIFIKDDVRLITTNKELIYSNHLDVLNSDLLIFASRHKSESGRPSLLVHCTGNWSDEAAYGGNPRELGISSGSAIKIALIELRKQKKSLELNNFDVSIEASHHGPTQLNTPLVFIELGSTPKDWKNQVGGLAVARAIMKVAQSDDTFKNYVGIGGPHYARKFSKLVLANKNIAVSHIIPKYMLDFITKEILLESIERSVEPVEKFIFDWKGMRSAQRKNAISIIESLNYDYEKAKSF